MSWTIRRCTLGPVSYTHLAGPDGGYPVWLYLLQEQAHKNAVELAEHWNRDYSLTQNCFSINTLNGRVKLSYFADGMSKYFDHTIYKFGTAKLVNKHGKYYLHIPVTYDVEESNFSDICNVVGIDRGINLSLIHI